VIRVNVTHLAVAAVAAVSACRPGPPPDQPPLGQLPTAVTTAEPSWLPFRVAAGKPVQQDPREVHLTDLRQLTFDGKAGAATWSPDGRRLLYEATQPGTSCSRIDQLDLDTGRIDRLPPGRGWAMGVVFGPRDSSHVLFAFTGAPGPQCVPPSERYRFDRLVLPTCDIYALDLPSGDLEPVISSPAYDGSLASTPDGAWVVLTSSRGGDPELYVARSDGSDLTKITDTPGYDGYAAYSPDGTKIVWLSERLAAEDIPAFRSQLAKGVVQPAKLSLMMAGARGQHPQVLVDDGAHNITPTFFPDSQRVLFASNRDGVPGQGSPNFELYAVDPDAPATAAGGPPLKRLTYYEGFDGAPAWSPDGRHVVFTSNRLAEKPGETNLFVAAWKE
jgi:Tol biopolymer transport system component